MPAARRLPSIDVILQLSESGLTYQQIADQYGVSKGAVAAATKRAKVRSRLPRATADERFWAKVDKAGAGGCWLWTASDDSHGYGQFMVTPGANVKAYRYAWEALRGPVPEGMTLDHLCRVKLCVNPAHLAVATQRANILRSNGPSARHAAKSHCIHGHPFDEVNTYAYRGRRMCRTCMRARKRAAAAVARPAR